MLLTICDISSLITMASAFIAMIFFNIRMSRCTYIKCPCCEIHRKTIEKDTSIENNV